MPVEIKVPSVGESITEGTLARWLKKDGESVRADEPVLELETEKATTEVAAPAAGKLQITVPEGRTVPIGSVVGRIEEGAAQAPPAKEKQIQAAKPDLTPSREEGDGRNQAGKPGKEALAKEEGEEKKASPSEQALPRPEAPLSPAARRL